MQERKQKERKQKERKQKDKKEKTQMQQLEQRNYVCPKCGNRSYEADQFQATGGTLSKLLDVQNKKFITVSCTRCGYTELYRGRTGAGGNVLDFLIGG